MSLCVNFIFSTILFTIFTITIVLHTTQDTQMTVFPWLTCIINWITVHKSILVIINAMGCVSCIHYKQILHDKYAYLSVVLTSTSIQYGWYKLSMTNKKWSLVLLFGGRILFIACQVFAKCEPRNQLYMDYIPVAKGTTPLWQRSISHEVQTIGHGSPDAIEPLL